MNNEPMGDERLGEIRALIARPVPSGRFNSPFPSIRDGILYTPLNSGAALELLAEVDRLRQERAVMLREATRRRMSREESMRFWTNSVPDEALAAVVESRDRAEAALARVTDDSMAETIALAITGRHGLAHSQAVSVAYKALWEIRAVATGEGCGHPNHGAADHDCHPFVTAGDPTPGGERG